MLIPVYFILMTCQTQDAYALTLFNVMADSGTLGNLDVASTIINAVRDVLKPDHQDGCNFHWKQVLHINLQKKKFPNEFITEVLWMFNFMSILPRDQLR
jgi:hypothetical protein